MLVWPWTKVEFDMSLGDLDAASRILESAGFHRFAGGRWWEWYVKTPKDETKAQLTRMGIFPDEYTLIRCRPKTH